MNIDFLVINSEYSGLSPQKIESLIDKQITFSNSLFKDNGILIERKKSSISSIDVLAPLSYLSLEAATLSTSELGDDVKLFGDTAFSDKKISKQINAWLKRKPQNYKVILVTEQKNSMECGSTYYSSAGSFSIVSLSEQGVCSSAWLLTHELGHQDGLSHTEGEDYYQTGLCGGEPSVMSEGYHGNRVALYGDSVACPNSRLVNSVYQFYQQNKNRLIKRKR